MKHSFLPILSAFLLAADPALRAANPAPVPAPAGEFDFAAEGAGDRPPKAPNPTPAEEVIYTKATQEDAAFGYTSSISFWKNDNSTIPKYRPWSDNPIVVVKSVFAAYPRFALSGDLLNGNILRMESGYFNGITAKEKILLPIVNFGDCFALKTVEHNNSIAKEGSVGGIPNGEVAQQVGRAYIDHGSEYPNLLFIFTKYLSLGHRMVIMSPAKYKWEDSLLSFEARPNLGHSMASQCIQNVMSRGGKARIRWSMSKWNEFKFNGEITNGQLHVP